MPTSAPPFVVDDTGAALGWFGDPGTKSEFLKGNQNFPNFIGFISNPVQA